MLCLRTKGTPTSCYRGYSYATTLLAVALVALACFTGGQCYAGEEKISPDVDNVGQLPDGIYLFTAEGCVPCERQKVDMEILKKRGFNVVYLDNKEYGKLFANLGGKATPFTVVVKEGKIQRKFRTYRPWYIIAPQARLLGHVIEEKVSFGLRASPC